MKEEPNPSLSMVSEGQEAGAELEGVMEGSGHDRLPWGRSQYCKHRDETVSVYDDYKSKSCSH